MHVCLWDGEAEGGFKAFLPASSSSWLTAQTVACPHDSPPRAVTQHLRPMWVGRESRSLHRAEPAARGVRGLPTHWEV